MTANEARVIQKKRKLAAQTAHIGFQSLLKKLYVVFLKTACFSFRVAAPR